MTNGDLIVAHSSDLHIGASSVIDEFHPLCRVIDTAEQANADVLLLAGDVFDHNRLRYPCWTRPRDGSATHL